MHVPVKTIAFARAGGKSAVTKMGSSERGENK